MFSKLEKVVERFHELERLLIDPSVMGDRSKVVEYNKEHSQMAPIVEKYTEYKKICKFLLLNGHKCAKKQTNIAICDFRQILV